MSAAPVKQWTIQVVSPVSGPMEILRDGAPLALTRIGPGEVTPVEVMLVSVGTCFALSCHAAFPVRQQQRVAFTVNVTGRKAPQLPSRLDDIRLEVHFAAGVPAPEARSIAALAKQMCTVTNTLSAVPPCTVSLEVATD